jgi:hypothetical protein
MTINFLSEKFPSDDLTDGQYLYRSLGSFWTKLFQDKAVLQGYTIAMAEELIQQYYSFIEVLNKYSIKEIDVFHKDKWLPLIIKKSEFNAVDLTFAKNDALFGYQPGSDEFYSGALFRFGEPKETQNNKSFAYAPGIGLKKIGLISNRIISPSLALLSGVDFIIKNDVIYFNTDIFADEYIPKAKIISDFGEPVKYVDSSGVVRDDEFVILWAYNAYSDQQFLQSFFGVLFDIKLASSESYKELLKSLMNLAVEGPTIAAIGQAVAALVGTPSIIETRETVEQIYDGVHLRGQAYTTVDQQLADSSISSKNCLPEYHRYIVTDKNVYRLHNLQSLADYVQVGATLYGGQPLSAQIKIIDTLIDPVWWKKELTGDKLVLPSYIFAADVDNRLFFEDTDAFIEYVDGKISFPVQGNPRDVEKFNDYLNSPSRKTHLLDKLNLPDKRFSKKVINPLEFVFNHFFKNNTLLLKIEFYCEDQMQLFLNIFDEIKKYAPPHVYLLVKLTVRLGHEQITNWNSSLVIDGEPCSIDGASTIAEKIGSRPGSIENTPDYYKNYRDRLFCVSISPHKYVGDSEDPPLPLHNPLNLASLPANNSPTPSSGAGIRAGILRTEIPEKIYIPEEGREITPTTKEIPSILLIDF